MSASLKIGLMGYGFAGATFHAPVIAHCGRASVAAIATSQPERALADYPHAKVVADFDALIALDDIDCVVIAVSRRTSGVVDFVIITKGARQRKRKRGLACARGRRGDEEAARHYVVSGKRGEAPTGR